MRLDRQITRTLRGSAKRIVPSHQWNVTTNTERGRSGRVSGRLVETPSLQQKLRKDIDIHPRSVFAALLLFDGKLEPVTCSKGATVFDVYVRPHRTELCDQGRECERKEMVRKEKTHPNNS